MCRYRPAINPSFPQVLNPPRIVSLRLRNREQRFYFAHVRQYNKLGLWARSYAGCSRKVQGSTQALVQRLCFPSRELTLNVCSVGYGAARADGPMSAKRMTRSIVFLRYHGSLELLVR